MKKLSCLFNHKYKKIKDVSIESFEESLRTLVTLVMS